MKISWIVVLVIIGVAIYFNIGYWVGDYFYNHTQIQKPDTFWAKLLNGGWGVVRNFGDRELTMGYSTIFWPIGLVITLVSWFLYGIFGGGFFELVGIFFSIDSPGMAMASMIMAIVLECWCIIKGAKGWGPHILAALLLICFFAAL